MSFIGSFGVEIIPGEDSLMAQGSHLPRETEGELTFQKANSEFRAPMDKNSSCRWIRRDGQIGKPSSAGRSEEDRDR